jgi:hypothetical protein
VYTQYSQLNLAKNNWAGNIKKLLIMFDQQECWNNQGSLYPNMNKVTRLLKRALQTRFSSSEWSSSIGLGVCMAGNNVKEKLMNSLKKILY